MGLEEYRTQLAEIDKQLADIFTKRLEICKKIGLYKKENGIPYFIPEVEEKVIERFIGFCPQELHDEAVTMVNAMVRCGVGVQEKLDK